ncbi:MAG: hypothetical protein LBB63_03265 [Holosporaceae bacterium]|jgi:hypothetical protein|nr:hypothetical protein [Holosporaceae bacterium]
MKKVVTVGFAACFTMGIVGEVVGIPSDSPAPNVNAYDESGTNPKHRENRPDRKLGDGFYVILGGGVGSVSNKMDSNTRLNDGGEWAVNNAAFGHAELPALLGSGYVVNHVDVDALNNLVASIDMTYRPGFSRVRGSTGFGSLGAGFGRCVGGRAYLGCEVSCDLGSSHRVTKYVQFPGTNGGASYSASSGGGSMNLDCRVGYLESAGPLLYLKLGVRRSRHIVSCGGASFTSKVSKVSPSLGIGVEQSVDRGLSMRLEGEHQFCAKHNAQLRFSPGYGVVFDDTVHANIAGLPCSAVSADVRQQNSRWCCRVLLQYNVGQL